METSQSTKCHRTQNSYQRYNFQFHKIQRFQFNFSVKDGPSFTRMGAKRRNSFWELTGGDVITGNPNLARSRQDTPRASAGLNQMRRAQLSAKRGALTAVGTAEKAVGETDASEVV
jgi:hypothetical protein